MYKNNMPTGINNGLQWSMLELSGLLEDEDARVHFQRSNRHLGLHPFQLNNLNKALREILSSNVNFYDADLQGLVLAYENPKLLNSLGAILYDSYFIHVDIEADFYIFRPEVGCTLKGIANKKADNHLGVLVHKAFNVSIPKPEDCQEWLGDYIFVGQLVKFTVTHLDFKGKLPFIRGKLISDPSIGQILYDSTKYEEGEVKPTVTEIGERQKNEKTETLDSEESTDDRDKIKKSKKKLRDKRIYDNTSGIVSDESCDDRDQIKKLGSSTKKLIDKKIRDKNKPPDPESSSEDRAKIQKNDPRSRKSLSRRKHANIVSDESEDETLRKGEIRDVERESSVEEKPKILDLKLPIKRSRKNRILDSDDESVIEIDVKPDIKVKKKRKKNHEEKEEEEEEVEKKKKKKYKVKAEDDDEVKIGEYNVKSEAAEKIKIKKKSEVNEVENGEDRKKKKIKKKYKVEEEIVAKSVPNDNEFEFIKPDLEAFEIPSAKCKRKHRKTITATDEASETAFFTENIEDENEFFRDRVKIEPDPSDTEDILPKIRKRKKRHSTNEDENEDGEKRDTLIEDVGIKAEPNMSDIEDSKPRKKKCKRRTREENSYEDVQIKVEPDASDVEGSNKFKRSFKTEPEETSKNHYENTTTKV